MGTPHVSVVIPVYNGVNFLKEAVESVFAQTYTDYEILIVDDGSTDDTPAVVASLGSRVRYFRKPNGGVATALNRGIREMRGCWFAWLSHDDLWMPRKLEKQVEFLNAHPDVSACYTDFRVIDGAGTALRDVRTPWYPRAQALRCLFSSSYIGGSTMLVGKRCFDELGAFDESLRTTQDAEMWLRVQRRFEIGRVGEVLIAQRVHAGQGSQTIASHEAEKAQTFERVFQSMDPAELFPELAGGRETQLVVRAHVWFADAMASRGFGDLACSHIMEALKVDPAWSNLARFRLFSMSARQALRPFSSWVRRRLAARGG